MAQQDVAPVRLNRAYCRKRSEHVNKASKPYVKGGKVGYDVPGSAHKANNEYSIDKEEHLFNTSALSKVVSKTSRYILCQA